MKAVVDQALGNVIYGDAEFLDYAGIDNAFVRHQAVGAGVENRKVIIQAPGNVVRV